MCIDYIPQKLSLQNVITNYKGLSKLLLLGSYYIQAEYCAIYVFLYNKILLSYKAQFKLFKGNYGSPRE